MPVKKNRENELEILAVYTPLIYEQSSDQMIYTRAAEAIEEMGYRCVIFSDDGENLKLEYVTMSDMMKAAAKNLTGFEPDDFYISYKEFDTYQEIKKKKEPVFLEDCKDIANEVMHIAYKGRPTVARLLEIGISVIIDVLINKLFPEILECTIICPFIINENVSGYLAVFGSGLVVEDIPTIKHFGSIISSARKLVELKAIQEKSLEALREAEEELLLKERYYRSILEKSPTGYMGLSGTGQIEYISMPEEHKPFYNNGEEDLMYEYFTDFVHPDDREYSRHAFSGLMLEEDASESMSVRIITPKGEVRHLIVSATNKLFDPAVNQVIVVYMDVTEQKKIDHETAINEQFLNDIIDSIPDGVCVFDTGMNVTRINRAMNQWYGGGPASGGFKCYEAIFKRNVPCENCPTMRCVESGRMEMEIVRGPEGATTEWLELYSFPIKDIETGEVRAVAEFIRDVTKRKQLEEKEYWMREQEKFALIGRVAGKMAHDFNNILSVIMGTSELLMADLLEPEVHDGLGVIHQSAIRGREITRNLIYFARDKEPSYCRFELNGKIDDILNSLSDWMCGIEIIRKLGAGLEGFTGDKGLMENALMNLVLNAVHAVSKTEEPRIYVRTRLNNGFVVIEVEDNGCGIPEKFMNKVFEPSFTLKGSMDSDGSYDATIKGSGYGLCNVKRCVEKHSGRISMESVQGKGTTVTVEIPLMDSEIRDDEFERIESAGAVKGRKILLVEDEPDYGEILDKLLRRFEHSVDLAHNGQQALDRITGHEFEYDAVSLDFILPDYDGMKIYRKIREFNKDVPVVFVSGNFEFMQNMIDLKGKDPNVDHLAKPFSNEEYVRKMHEWLR